MISMEQKEKDKLLEKIQGKPDLEAFVKEVLQQPEYIPVLFAIIRNDPGSAKFYCEKVIRIVSERMPECVYPYFEEVAALIGSPNSFIKWGAIITLSNLAAVDTENKFASVYEKYFGLIAADAMVTAANVIGNAWKIILSKPEYEQDITRSACCGFQKTPTFTKGNIVPGMQEHPLRARDRLFRQILRVGP